jgi:hypothetical protein
MLNEDLQIKCDNIWRRAFESVIAQLKLGYVVGHREDAKLMETKVTPKHFSYELKPFSDVYVSQTCSSQQITSLD